MKVKIKRNKEAENPIKTIKQYSETPQQRWARCHK